MGEVVVPSFVNLKCEGCGQPAAVSTRIGTPITCPCGVTHTVKGIVVSSDGESTDPGWHDAKVAAGRAAR